MFSEVLEAGFRTGFLTSQADAICFRTLSKFRGNVYGATGRDFHAGGILESDVLAEELFAALRNCSSSACSCLRLLSCSVMRTALKFCPHM